MRILVISDSHRHPEIIQKILHEQPSAQDVYFLGDVIGDIEQAARLFPERRFHTVSGNCDFASTVPSQALGECGGIKIFYTHGHTLGVKNSTERLFSLAKQRGCRIALFGHTHIAHNEYRDGIYLINPGSCANSRSGAESYAVIDIEPNGILPIHIKLR